MPYGVGGGDLSTSPPPGNVRFPWGGGVGLGVEGLLFCFGRPCGGGSISLQHVFFAALSHPVQVPSSSSSSSSSSGSSAEQLALQVPSAGASASHQASY
jgi:hypothetical protein